MWNAQELKLPQEVIVARPHPLTFTMFGTEWKMVLGLDTLAEILASVKVFNHMTAAAALDDCFPMATGEQGDGGGHKRH